MKKNLIYLLLLAVVAGVFVWMQRDKKTADATSPDQDFAVKDVSGIDRIFLADKSNTIADLRKEGNHWVINGKYKAFQPTVNVLLETIQKVQVYYPISNKRWNEVVKDLATKSTIVELYKNGETKPFKVYHVGGNTEDSRGTYMIMEINGKVAEKPYITHLPGMQGIINVRYFTDEVSWRDTGVFDYSAEQIRQVAINYFTQPEHSFTITAIDEDSINVSRGFENIEDNTKPLNKDFLLRYLSSFSFLNVEGFVNERPGKDSVLASQPLLEIQVKDIAGKQKNMVVYLMPTGKRTKYQFDRAGEAIPYDIDRYYALLNEGKDFAIIQDFVFGKVFRKYDDFFAKSKPL